MFRFTLFVFKNQGKTVSLMCPFVAYIHPDIVKLRDFPRKGVVHFFVGLAWFQHGKSSVTVMHSHAGAWERGEGRFCILTSDF